MNDATSFLDLIKEHIASEETKLPAFSKTAMQIQQEAGKKDCNLKKIQQLIVCDQALTGQVLKIANSSFFVGLEPVKTIHEAIVRLGIDEIVNMVTLASHETSFHSTDPFIKDLFSSLWRHSVACAFGSQWIAKRCGFEDMVHEVFFAGLLHDVGKLFLITVVEAVKKTGKLNMELSSPFIGQMMTAMHTEQGSLLMQKWNLPGAYCDIARDHHLEKFDGSDALMAIVRLADSVSNKGGICVTGGETSATSVNDEADFVGLSEVALAELEVYLEDCMKKLKRN